MSNLLSIPFKKTYPIDIKQAAKRYIAEHVAGAHPDEFKEDIKTWQDLRKDGIGGVVHENRIDSSLLYHIQLVSVLTKLPTDIQLSISYAPVFNDSAIPITLNNLAFERAAVLFNLAALYSQLASSEDRSTTEGIRRAVSNYQQAAGTLSYLGTTVIPKMPVSIEEEDIPLDLSTEFVKGLEWLMLAQAQECSWQLAKLNQYRNSLIAKIAFGTGELYRSATTTFKNLPSSIRHILPREWLAHMEAKEHHFLAVAEYRESMVEYEASRYFRRYGVELGRLGKAQTEAKKAYDVARRGKVAASVIQDAQSLLETVKASEVRTQRDNDLIYHQVVPSPSALPVLSHTIVAVANIPKGILNPSSILGNRHQLFGELASWGACEAINIYNDRKKNLLDEKIIEAAKDLQDEIDESLRKLNLPSALEALERPIGLPPSLLRKVEEVRLEDGPARIEASLEDVTKLGHHDQAILEDALDILDSEASEDETARKEASLNRPKSYEANVELIEKATRYRNILSDAAESDEIVRQKWDEWEESICELALDEATLEASIPSTTTSPSATSTAEGKKTREHARQMRVKLEELDTVSQDREQIVRRARSLADADDIKPRIMKASSGLQQLVDITPDIFEDVSDEELAKYDKFLLEIDDIARRQGDLLSSIENQNVELLNSRKEDPALKERENALQALDIAYSKYREITRNLEEGYKFYNDFAGILMQFKEVCKTWSIQRSQELRSFKLTQSMQSMSIREDESRQEQVDTPSSTPSAASSSGLPPIARSSLGLPSINSSEWDFEELTLPPAPPRK
ncbi:BRO1-domain-containing protein [Pholiota conissans]|uniref:BRO1-domain-containing protein n=1 Tax=Pholiota conissans TaxID=109636 RepID=A0A9P6CS83_9AGAR|nr:BRO1-domain-containing protein [Pholiota conissans]